jgi:hypothetical protein
VKRKSKTSIIVPPGISSPRSINPNTKLICNWLGRYHRGLETRDFIYFINYQEGDENACVMMYRREGLELASNNYFAYGAMFETLTEEKDWTYISRSMKYNLKLHLDAETKG